ncbi:MAG: phospholipid carrier-dependent glycosyltransferase [Elusimicrobiaceae bacterium]
MKKAVFLFSALWVFAAVFAWSRNFAGIYAFELWNTALFAVFACAVYGAGRRLIGARAEALGGKGYVFAASLSVGLAAFSYAMVLLGALKLFYPVTAVLLLGGFLWFGRANMKPDITLPDFKENIFLSAPVLLLLAAAFFIAWMPPHQYDSLVYHLALPEIYTVRHALVTVPDSVFSYFPQNGEMFFTFGLLLKSDILGQMIVWLALAAACVWTYAYAMELTGAGLLAVFLVVTHTSVLLMASTTYVETFVTLWLTAGVISFLKWAGQRGGPNAFIWLVLSGIFCGAGFGTKYYAGIAIGILFLLGVYCVFRLGTFSARRRTMLELLGFAGICALLFLPWGIKNIVSVGNPVFPFFYKFGGGAADLAKGYFRVLSEYGHHNGFFMNLLRFPFQAVTSPGNFGGGMDVLGGIGWELFFLSVPLMLLALRENRKLRILGVYLLAHWFVWFATGKVMRFLTVIVPLSSVLAAAGFYFAAKNYGSRVRVLLWTGLAVFTVTRILMFAHVQNIFEVPGILSGVNSRPEYLSARLSYYPCADFVANEHLGTKVLYAGEQRTFYTGADSVGTNVFRVNGFVKWADAGTIETEIRKNKISRVITVVKEAERLRPYGTLDFTEQGRAAWIAYLNGLQPLYSADSCTVYSTGVLNGND